MGARYNPWKTVNNIRILRKRGVRCRINTVVTRQSREELADLESVARELEVEKWSFAYPYAYPPMMSMSEFSDITDWVVSLAKSKNSPVYVSPEGCMVYATSSFGRVVIGHLSDYQKLTYGCEVGQSILEIESRGEIYPSVAMMAQRHVIGNAFSEDWFDAWNNSPKLDLFRSAISHDSCDKCNFNSFCKGGCPAYRESAGVALTVRDPRCEVAL